MATVKESALALVDLIYATKATMPPGALDGLHRELRRMLYLHGPAAGLSKADIAEIDNAGIQYGGTPKEPPPEQP